jgi:hypothetical protein
MKCTFTTCCDGDTSEIVSGDGEHENVLKIKENLLTSSLMLPNEHQERCVTRGDEPCDFVDNLQPFT